MPQITSALDSTAPVAQKITKTAVKASSAAVNTAVPVLKVCMILIVQ